MPELFTLLLKYLEPNWHKSYTPFILAIALDLIIIVPLKNSSLMFIIPILSISFLLVIITWLLLHQIPKVPKGKIGIILAIECDQEAEEKQLEMDFIRSLRQLLQRDPMGANFYLLVLPKYLCKKFEDISKIDRITTKCRGNLILYGHIRKRAINGKEMHLLNIDGGVKHAKIPREVSNNLSIDFGNSIPRKLMINTENDALTFEAASVWFDLCCRYVIGIAAYLSGAAGYSEKLLCNVEEMLLKAIKPPPFLQTIAKNLPNRFIELYSNWLTPIYNKYYESKDLSYLIKANEIASKLLKRDPLNYSAALTKSIAEFILNKDIQRAKEYCLRHKKSGYSTWAYNAAFLYAYEGNLQQSHEYYRIAFKGKIDNITTAIQCEEFMQEILSIEPEKKQLYFALGLINYNIKKDYESAKNDFERYLASDISVKYVNETELSKKLIHRCDEYIKKVSI